MLKVLRHRPAMLVERSAQSGRSVANMVRAADAVDLEGPAFVRYRRGRGQGAGQQKSDEQQGAVDLHLGRMYMCFLAVTNARMARDGQRRGGSEKRVGNEGREL